MSLGQHEIKETYPLPVYNYRVTMMVNGDANVIGFSEVSGLSLAYEHVTYKHGLSFLMGAKIIPGMKQPVQITLKKGIVKGQSYIRDWIVNTYIDPANTAVKRDIVIDLCDETALPIIRWKVQGALPVKMDIPTFDAKSSEVAIDTLELVAHGIEISYDP